MKGKLIPYILSALFCAAPAIAADGDSVQQCRAFYQGLVLDKAETKCLASNGLSIVSNNVGTWVEGPIGTLDTSTLETGVSCIQQDAQTTGPQCGAWIQKSITIYK